MLGGPPRQVGIRLGRSALVIGVVVLGYLLRRSGAGGFLTFRALYVVVIGLVFWKMRTAGRRRPGANRSAGPRGGVGDQHSVFGRQTRAGAERRADEVIDVRRVAGPGQASGWYPDPADPAIERYWDGGAWAFARKVGSSEPRPEDPPTR